MTDGSPARTERWNSSAAACFRVAAIRYRLQGSPFYAELARLAAEDPELMALADETPEGQPQNHLIFGAVHFLLLGDPADPFAPLFGVGGREPVADAATFAALKDFCRRRRGEIATLLRSRTVQFTMVGRAAFVPILLGHALNKGAVEPLSLIEVGASAGLLTVFDHYRYDYGAFGRLGDPAAPQVAVPRLEGSAPPIPDHMPGIADRVGLDLNPVDPSDPVERRWIEAMLAPDMAADRLMLSQALDRRSQIPFQTVAGDALRTLPALMPSRAGAICVFHSYCLYQWPAALQREFDLMLRAESRGRTIWRLAIDMIHDNPVRPAIPVAAGDDLVMDMVAVVYRDGDADWNCLGRCDVWGRRLLWLA